MPRNKKPFQPKDLDSTLAAMEPRSAMEIKNLSLNTSLSEETHCFSASVYINGKRMFSVSNRGCGGANEYSPLNHGGLDHHLLEKGRKDFEESMCLAREEAKQYTLKKIELGEDLQWAIDKFGDGKSDELIDWLITDLINEPLILKEMRKTLKKKITIYDSKKKQTFSLGKDKPTNENIDKYKDHFAKKSDEKSAKDWVWLNMIPEAEAYKYWRTAS